MAGTTVTVRPLGRPTPGSNGDLIEQLRVQMNKVTVDLEKLRAGMAATATALDADTGVGFAGFGTLCDVATAGQMTAASIAVLF